MKPLRASPLLRLFFLAALLFLPSCDKQRVLRDELETVKADLAKSRERQRSVEEQIRAIDAAHPGTKTEKLPAAEQELRAIAADLQVLKNRAENAEKKHQQLVDELAFYQKELTKL